MIENLRKYTGLMIIALVLVFVGLVLFVDTGLLSGRNRGATAMRIDGRGYSIQDYRQLGEHSINLAAMLQMYNLLGQLGGNPFQPDPEQFFVNRILVDRAQDEFGVHPSEEQITRFIREKTPFARGGKFDEALYSDFIQKRIGRFGLSESDVRELVRDHLAVEKLFEIVGTGLLGNFDYNNRAYASENQRLTVNIAQFDLASYEEKQNPDEAAVKQFWEENKDAYKTSPRRKFTYLLVSPKYPDAKPEAKPADSAPAADSAQPAADPAKPADTPAPPPPPQSPDDTGKAPDSAAPAPQPTPAATPATPAAVPTTPTPPADATKPAEPAKPDPAKPDPAKPDPAKAAEEAAKAAKAAAEAEARRKVDLALAEDVDSFLGQLESSQGGEFETLAKENDWEVKKTDFFSRSSLPKELDLKVRGGGNRQQDVADYLFGMNLTSDPLSKFTPAIPVGENQWFIARLDEEEKETVKSYEDARAEARAQLIERLAKEAMKSEAENAAKMLRDSLQAGKTFEAAAKELNLKTRSLGPFTNRDQPEGETDPRAIFQHAATADPGSIPDVLAQDERALIVHVVSRELVKEENLRSRIDAQVNSESSRNQYAAFQAWLSDRRNAADVKQPGRDTQ